MQIEKRHENVYGFEKRLIYMKLYVLYYFNLIIL
jgi:hypothetical protein